MAIFKCKMCGASLDIVEGSTVCECEYCMTKQTLPKLTDEKRANLYDRANHFRRNNEFDKAMGIYENILNEDSTDAEAYWSLVLCHYGIEYVEDPATKRRLPTVNRAQYTSIFADENYKSAIANADIYQKSIYESEAKAIDEIQKGILAISQKESPFDVFICYKETDVSGRRTQDSVLAQELYYGLTNEGFKVFFSRITLEDKLGSAYEPYIFAALNSAKVMVVLGTRQEHFNAVWVKNEWSRYLSLIKQGKQKTLIPAYKDVDPYDLPEEFSHLQAQDMSKLGFMQDLIRGIKKIVSKDEPKTSTVVKETVVQSASTNVAPLLKRAFMFLEDGDWKSADEYCEKVLDQDPENAQAYLGKLMAELKVKKQDDLKKCEEPFDNRDNYKKIMRFGDEKLKSTLKGYIEAVNTRCLENVYASAVSIIKEATSVSNYEQAISKLKGIRGWKDTDELIIKCQKEIEKLKIKAENERKDAILNNAKGKIDTASIWDLESLITELEKIIDWKDAAKQVELLKVKIAELENNAQEKKKALNAKRKKRNKIIAISVAVVIFLIIFAVVFIPKIRIKVYISQGRYAEAIEKGKLTEFTIPDGVMKIDANEFSGCAILERVTIPESVTDIGDSAFEDCSNLTSITIPNSVTSIGNYAFSSCSNLTSITIPNSVTSIGSGAFRECYRLTSITIPNSVTSIGDWVFNWCKNLTSITIPNSVTSIGFGAFYECTNLTSITIPNSVTYIGEYAFYYCSNLEIINYSGTEKQWNEITEANIWNTLTPNTLKINYNYTSE